MSNKSWLEQLQNKFARLTIDDTVSLVGIGHPFWSDDAAGLFLVRRLKQMVNIPDKLLLIEAGPIPENFTGSLRAFAPSLVIVVDAADMGLSPGSISLLGWQQVKTSRISTRNHSLHLFGTYLMTELNCQLKLIAIQPNKITYGDQLTPILDVAISKCAAELAELIKIYLKDTSEHNLSDKERIRLA